jgi:predicted dehydrogenase
MVQTVSKELRLGVVGIGSIGRVHAENLAGRISNARLIAVADTNLPAAETLASSLGVKAVYSDYRKLLTNVDVDAVVIAVPTFLKREMTIAAAEAGKHIFCEKPMALSLEEANLMIGAKERASVKFQVGFMRRFDQSHLMAKEAIKRGELGDILMISSHGRDPGKVAGWGADPKLSGGVFAENCSHDFDSIRWLCATEVSRVYVDGSAFLFDEMRNNGDYDNAAIMHRLASGTIGQVDTGYSVYGHDVRVEVMGSEGAILMSMGKETNTAVLKRDSISNQYPRSYPARFAQAYRDEMTDFVACVLEDREPKVTAKDGRAAVEIALAAWRSVKETKPISLPL